MCSLAAVGVHYNLAARQSGVPVRASDYEFARRIDVQYIAFGIGLLIIFPLEQGSLRLRNLLEHLRNQDFLHVLAYFGLHKEIVGSELVVLGGNHYGMDAYRFARLSVIFHGELGLCVRTQIRHPGVLFPPYAGKHPQGYM